MRLTNDPWKRAFNASWTPDGSQLSFISLGADKYELWVMDPIPDSNFASLVRHEGGNIWSHAWSPDGSQIVYSVQVSHEPNLRETYIVPSSGGSPELLLSTNWLTDGLAWSPLGDQICFYSEQNENTDIWVISPTGGTPLQLTTDPARDTYPAWSPDGSQIAFASKRAGNSDIWVMSATGGNPTQLTFDPVGKEYYPSWSPDGKAITYTIISDANIADIWILYFE